MKTKDDAHILAWHFLPAIGQLSNGDKRKVIVGETLSHEGGIDICNSGLHASLKPRDALSFQRGTVLCRVECWGDKQEQGDKIVVRHRKCLAMVDITPQLRLFAVLCAESALPIFEKRFPEDKRPRECVEVTKRYLAGKATLDELSVAKKHAYAAYADAYSASAAYYAADAADAADAAAAHAAYAAASYAAAAYAYSAADAAAARKQHLEWQNKTLISLIPKEFDEWK